MPENNIIGKFKLAGYEKRLLLGKPAEVHELDELSFDTEVIEEHYEVILAFVYTLEEMAAIINRVVRGQLLQAKGLLYLIYPKKGNKLYPQSIGRDSIFPYLGVSDETGYVGETGMKFNNMASFNEHLTIIGIRYLPDRPAAPNRPSQRVADYAGHVPDLRLFLANYPAVLQIYEALTPGYQNDWARYVYSAKTPATAERRRQEMLSTLAQGYKSLALYRLKKK